MSRENENDAPAGDRGEQQQQSAQQQRDCYNNKLCGDINKTFSDRYNRQQIACFNYIKNSEGSSVYEVASGVGLYAEVVRDIVMGFERKGLVRRDPWGGYHLQKTVKEAGQ